MNRTSATRVGRAISARMSAPQRIRTRLLVHFLAFSFLCLGSIVTLSWNTHHAKNRATQLSNELKSLQQLCYDNALLSKSFLLHDAQNIQYHRTGQSEYLDKKKVSDVAIERCIASIQLDHPEIPTTDSSALALILVQHKAGTVNLKVIVERIRQRGMEDHGMEGAMRESVHALETSGVIPLHDLLSLRRTEKDYIIRQQEKYVIRLHEQISALLTNLRAQPDRQRMRRATDLLHSYQTSFDRIVELDGQIGVRNHTGLFARLCDSENVVGETLRTLMLSNQEQYQRTEHELVLAYLVSVAGFLLLSIIFAFLVSDRIAGPIKALAASVQEYVGSDLRQAQPALKRRSRDREVINLAHHFDMLQKEIHGHLAQLNEKVAQRTSELNKEKEHIRERNAELMASLQYARGIQESMLNSSKNIAELLPESFVLNLPRDIVGGDFMWTHTRPQDGDHRIYFALADCTGHGVPASLLSVICHNALNDAMADLREPAPSAILERVNERFSHFFGTGYGQGLSDGMSISLCAYDPHDLTLTFAGSFQSIYVVDNGEVVRLKGDRIPIGGGLPLSDQGRFVDHEHRLADGSMIYLFSDGYIDQFGGPDGRKLNSKLFRALLGQLSRVPIGHQHRQILNAFNSWKGPLEQVDDVMVLGIRARKVTAAAMVERSAA